MFSTIGFHNHHFISTDCLHYPFITKIALPQLPRYTSLLPSPKKLLLHIKFYEKPLSLINKLQLLSYQSTSNRTARLSLHTSQPTLKIHNASTLLTNP